jgi:hypothetical protein
MMLCLVPHAIADDVVLGAAVNRADRHDAGFERIDRAAHERLQRHYDLRRDQHGVDSAMRIRAVRADAVDDDVDAIRARHRDRLRHHDRAGRGRRPNVEAEREVRLREARVEAVCKHVPRAADALFGRLADQHDRAGPRVLARGELLRGADERRHVHVVAARVHDRLLDARRVGLALRGRVREPALLGDGQPVHVGAE